MRRQTYFVTDCAAVASKTKHNHRFCICLLIYAAESTALCLNLLYSIATEWTPTGTLGR